MKIGHVDLNYLWLSRELNANPLLSLPALYPPLVVGKAHTERSQRGTLQEWALQDSFSLESDALSRTFYSGNYPAASG